MTANWKEYWKSNSIRRKITEFFREKYFSKVFCDIIENYCDKNSLILEAGCGSGKYLKKLTEKGYTCSGIDNCKASVNRAKKNCKNVILGDIFKLSNHFKHKQFDIIYSQGVMEHFNLEETDRIYKEMSKIGKKIIVLVPSNLSLFRFYDFYKDDPDKIFFSKKKLEKRMKRSFKNVEVMYLPKTFFLTIMAYGESND